MEDNSFEFKVLLNFLNKKCMVLKQFSRSDLTMS